MTNFTPLFAAMFSIILLNESVHTYHIISAILITAGILICSYKNIKRRYSMFRTDITERFEQLKAAKTVKLHKLLLSNLSSKIFTGSSLTKWLMNSVKNLNALVLSWLYIALPLLPVMRLHQFPILM